MKNYADDDYATCVETYSTLRIFADDLSPEEITGILGIEPSRAFGKGDALRSSGGSRKRTGWFYSTRNFLNSRDTRRHIDEILFTIDGKTDVLNQLRGLGCTIDISSYWVSIGQGGPCIDHEQMGRLAELKISLWWDVYFEPEWRSNAQKG